MAAAIHEEIHIQSQVEHQPDPHEREAIGFRKGRIDQEIKIIRRRHQLHPGLIGQVAVTFQRLDIYV
jgi:hypothetical protein